MTDATTQGPLSIPAGGRHHGPSSEAGSTFLCQVDDVSAGSCTSPLDLARLSRKRHTLKVYARDAAGNRDATPATFSWKIKRNHRRR